MKLRKLCALALAGLLTLSALAGCTSAKTIVGGNTSSTSAESSSSSEAASEGSTASSEPESSASTGEAMFASLADTLESEVGLSGVHVRLVYLNGDGSEIYTHDFE